MAPENSAAPNDKPTNRKRALTEARRAQNRLAQRIFRQRQRERKNKASSITVSVTHRQLRPRPASEDDASDIIHRVEGRLGKESVEIAPGIDSFQCLGMLDDTLQLLEAMTPESLPFPEFNLNATPETHQEEGSCTSLSTPNTTNTQPLNQLLAQANRQSQTLPCLQTNAIQLFPTTMFSAILRNALSLMLDLTELSSCKSTYSSPFYRPSTPRDDPKTLLSTVRLSLPINTPEHLKPTLAQVLIPHHASLDLIPLPLLRERAIMLSAAMPAVYNLWELKVDIYERRGLTVWAGGRGGEGGGACQPWDMRSWEAAPWFLSKWSLVVDGEEGDIWKQSKWFQSIRKSQLISTMGQEGFSF